MMTKAIALTKRCRFINIKLLLFLLLSLSLLSIATGKVNQGNQITDTIKPDSLEDLALQRAMGYVYQDSFPSAYACLDSIIALRKSCWSAYVIKAGIVYTEMTDDEQFDREEYFKALIDTALDGLNNFLDDSPEDNWALFFKGTAMGYLALWEGHHGSWVKAVFKGLDAGKIYSKTVKQDSLFYDGYLGLGTLNYWRSAKIGFIRSLPFIADNRDLGIEQITLAMDSSRYSSQAAALGLAWIYIDRKEYNKAIYITNEVLKHGPIGRQALWPRGIAEFLRGNAPGTIDNFTQIMAGLERKGNQNYYNISLCEYYIGMAHYWMGDYTSALNYFDTMLARQVDKSVRKRLKNKYEAAEKYKEKIARKIEADKQRMKKFF